MTSTPAPGHRVQRIAHAYGNSRDTLVQALAADVDMIEVDCWYDGGLWARHAKRLSPLPLLIDHQMRGHPIPPWSLSLPGNHVARLDFNRLSLNEVIRTTAGTKRLLIDTKGAHDKREGGRFAGALVNVIGRHSAHASVSVCGQFYPVLDAFRQLAPDVEVRYSIENSRQWRWFTNLAGRDERVRHICIQHKFIDPEKAAFVERLGINLYCWTVDDRAQAGSLVAAGVDGIISNNLDLLASLP